MPDSAVRFGTKVLHAGLVSTAIVRDTKRMAGARIPHGISRASMVIAALSTIVEWYDFTLYLYFATVLARVLPEQKLARVKALRDEGAVSRPDQVAGRRALHDGRLETVVLANGPRREISAVGPSHDPERSAVETIAAAAPSVVGQQSKSPSGSATLGAFACISAVISFWKWALGFSEPW